MLNDPTLVLNRSWVAISTTTVRQAMTLVCRGAARVIHPVTCQVHDFKSWTDLKVAANEPHIRTVHLKIRIPEVIVLTHNDCMPRRTVPFSRRNLYRRDHSPVPVLRAPAQHRRPQHRSRGSAKPWRAHDLGELRPVVHSVQRAQGKPAARGSRDGAREAPRPSHVDAVSRDRHGAPAGIVGPVRQRSVLERRARSRRLTPVFRA